jgi:GR25 family glycosyltransferase involved in LPS biosynthesis
MKYSIGIITFEKRFDKYFKPLVNKIKECRPDIEIIVCVNGQYKQSFNQTYLKEVLNFCSKHSNVFPQVFTRFNSLAKLWNRVILNSTNELVLVLNDDVVIKEGFFDFIEQKNNFYWKLVLFNSTFEHFFIDRNFLQSLNWFDERFLGVGREDRDIQRKIGYDLIENPDYNIKTSLIESKHIETNIPIENMVNHSFMGENGFIKKYSKFNHTIFDQKWKQNVLPEDTQYPYYKYEQKHYDKL